MIYGSSVSRRMLKGSSVSRGRALSLSARGSGLVGAAITVSPVSAVSKNEYFMLNRQTGQKKLDVTRLR